MATFVHGLSGGVVVGRSLREMVWHDRLPVATAGSAEVKCELKFVYQRTTFAAELIVKERIEGTAHGARRRLDIRIVDEATKATFEAEDEWAADCIRRAAAPTSARAGSRPARPPPKMAFIPWDKIHVWIGGEDQGTLNGLRRIAGGVQSSDEADLKSSHKKGSHAKKVRPALDDQVEEESEGEDEAAEEWCTLEDIMKGEAEEDSSAAVGESEEQQLREEAAAEDENEVSSEASAAVGGQDRVMEAESEWARINAKEVRVFGRPFLGFGAFAVVKRGEWDGVPVAIKSINKLKKGQYAKGIQRELAVWWPSRHPHIVSLYGALESESHIYIIMERLHINMAQAVERLPHSRVIANMKRWALHVASAMHFLHSRNILHRDLKLGNILLTKDLKSCKIADFGTAVKEKEADNIVVGTTEYMAPELHTRSPHTKKMDIYSFGILLWKLFHPQVYPYPKHDPVSHGSGKRHRNILLKVVHDGARPLINRSIVPPAWRELMELCWAANPEDRPSFEEIVHTLKDMQV